MKNSPSAVAGGLFFCVPEWGVSRSGGECIILSPTGIISRLRAQASGGHISFCEERNVGKKVA